MQFADPADQAQAYLILRHLYDGDVIEWPVAADHPLRAIFDALEQQGELARWDRTWPRHDRYRLTEQGIATIEAVYRPAGAAGIWSAMRARDLAPPQRRSFLSDQGYDPFLWGLLHDPSTHWDSYRDDRGRYLDYLWEDDRNRRYRTPRWDADGGVDLDEQRRRDDAATAAAAAAGAALKPGAHVVDLDREASANGPAYDVERNDYDVS